MGYFLSFFGFGEFGGGLVECWRGSEDGYGVEIFLWGRVD